MSNLEGDFEKLGSVFHEPRRLSIVSELSVERDGLSFVDLKERCELTDGNLSRHLATLEKAKVVKIRKAFVQNKPRTTVTLTDSGKEAFLSYLQSLERVIKSVSQRATASPRHARARKITI